MLSDGAPVELRPILPSDAQALSAFHSRQSPESIYFRFFQHRPKLTTSELDYFTKVDYQDRMAFVALVGGELLAVARYEKGDYNPRPEVAFFVDDRHHGRGLGTLLLEFLAAAARDRGHDGFVASVLPENYAMLGVFRKAGFGVSTRFDDGIIEVDIDIAIDAEAAEAIAARESRARSRSVARLLRPSSVAVVGAGRRPGSVGHELLRRVVDGGFTGPVYPINNAASEVRGLRAWPSLAALGEPVDLVVVAVPAPAVPSVVADAASTGAGGLLVITSGFADAGSAGRAVERELVGTARSNGMRLIGPNSFGVVNTDAEVRLQALFLDVASLPGSVGVLSQSGTLGGGLLDLLRNRGIGISSFVSVGNRADVSVNDVLDYWVVDEATELVLLYVENYGNLRNFARTVRSLSAAKPVLTVRPPDEHLVELLEQSGVVLVDGVGEMTEVARVMATQPLPAGSRVVVVSNSTSIARLAVAACRRQGLDVVVPASVDAVAGHSLERGVEAVLVGDVDASAAVGVDDGIDDERTIVAAAVSSEVDAVMVILVPSLDLPVPDLVGLLDRVNRSIDKPVIAAGLVGEDRLAVPGLPVFEFPEEGARALGHLASHARWRRDNPGHPPPLDDEIHAEAEAALRPCLDDLPGAGGFEGTTVTMDDPAMGRLVEALALPVAPWSVITSADELDRAASEVGFPLVLKAGRLAERSVGEAGGVAIDLYDLGQLRSAFRRMLALQGADAFLPAIVQRMVPSTANAMVEVVQGPDRASVVKVGVGGAVGSRFEPVASRFLPLSESDRRSLIDELGAVVPMGPESRAVVDAIVARVATMAEAVCELTRLHFDPILIGGDATAIGDLTVEVRWWRTDPLGGVRHLS